MGILDWVKSIENKKIYIYGKGKRGDCVHKLITENGIKVAGYVVSNNFSKKEEEQIFHLNELKAEESAIILAIKYCHFNHVLPEIVKAHISDIYFLQGNDLKILEYYNELFEKKDIAEIYPNRWNAYSSSKKIFEYLINRIKINSVIDFGCGSGAWLKAIRELNPNVKILGLDKSDVDRSEFLEESEYRKFDLSKDKFVPDEKYDLAISIEVAEHIEEKNINNFIDNICVSSDIVLFSAAIKYQGGDYHVNEQFHSYWIKKFDERGYGYIDCIRGHFWTDTEMQLHIRQNCILYVKKDKLYQMKEKLGEERFMDAVHPELFENIMWAIYEGIY